MSRQAKVTTLVVVMTTFVVAATVAIGRGDGAPSVPVKGPTKVATKRPITQPNIVFVLADDQRADNLACMKTLADTLGDGHAVTFDAHHAGTPLCCPARTTQFTGMFAHRHGVLTNGDDEDGDSVSIPGMVTFDSLGLEEQTVARWLQEAGYRTAFFGKYLNGYEQVLDGNTAKNIVAQPEYVPPYWDDWYAFKHAEYYNFQLVERARGGALERVCYQTKVKNKLIGGTKTMCATGATRTVKPKKGVENYSTDVLRDKAVSFIAGTKGEATPFFMYLAVKAPHAPYDAPNRYQKDKKKFTMTAEAKTRLDGCDLLEWKDRPRSVGEDVAGKPTWLSQLPAHDDKKLDELRHKQLTSVLATEDAVVAIKDALKAAGKLDNTVIIYIGDNGYAWGEHGYVKKNCVYEACTRVPFVIWDPRTTPRVPVVDAFTQDVDVAPTLLALAGADTPRGVTFDGQSVLSLRTGGTWPRTEVLAECWGRNQPKKGSPPISASVRDTSWHYIEIYDDEAREHRSTSAAGKPQIELYDMRVPAEEREHVNLAGLTDRAVTDAGYDPAVVAKALTSYHDKLVRLAELDHPVGGYSLPTARTLTAQPSTTVKLEQLIGDHDKATGQDTRGLTETRFGLRGTDLGYPFEDNGRVMFLFGDGMGPGDDDGVGDPFGYTSVTDPEQGVALEFLSKGAGTFRRAKKIPKGETEKSKLKGFEMPVAGIRLGTKTYIAYKDNHTRDTDEARTDLHTDKTHVGLFNEAAGTIKELWLLSDQGGRFNKLSMALVPDGVVGYPGRGPWVVIFGAGHHRGANVSLAIVPMATFATGKGIQYFKKLEAGKPVWTTVESEAGSIITDHTIGEISVTFGRGTGRWLAFFDAKADEAGGARGVWFSHSIYPWGPWATPQEIFSAKEDVNGKFIHSKPKKNEASDGLAGPMIGADHRADMENNNGTIYAPYVVQRWTKLSGDVLMVYFVISTWNPYVVVLMRTELAVTW